MNTNLAHILHVNLGNDICRLIYISQEVAKFNRDILVRYGFTVVYETSQTVPERSLEEADLACRISIFIQQKINSQNYNHRGVLSKLLLEHKSEFN